KSRSDYTRTSVVVKFAKGQAEAAVQIKLKNDTVSEGNETFKITLSKPTGGATLGATTVGTITILDDDPPPPPAPRLTGITPIRDASGLIEVVLQFDLPLDPKGAANKSSYRLRTGTNGRYTRTVAISKV